MTCKECLDGALKAEEECSVCSGPAAEKARKIADDVERLKQLFISHPPGGISYTTTTTSTLPGSWVQTGSSSSVTIPTGTTFTATYTSDLTKD